MIKLIVGLGNPGPQYQKTRHNAGFLFLDHLLSTSCGKWSHNAQFSGDVATYLGFGCNVLLLKPMTFMNKSGISVTKMLHYYKLKPEELLVVHDELELAEGLVRLKRDGGHAGHNGLRDIIAHLNTRDFFRLRVGIGRPNSGANIADYVLSKPSSQALEAFDELFARLAAEISSLVSVDINTINTKFGS
ncbi:MULTISPECIES: aminoacyl-tRNA hydrolase [Methylomonas]|uniref:aminoacyl-tRNA hydrolase n=1 Tax=Methylomonas TaxID=416 RepID=UPI001232A909|nr:aminoacyl-tRNA hydrolase [Methylomonas rhizoryzae]